MIKHIKGYYAECCLGTVSQAVSVCQIQPDITFDTVAMYLGVQERIITVINFNYH